MLIIIITMRGEILKKPLIKLLESSEGYYFYDMKKHDIVEINKETFFWLKQQEKRLSWSCTDAPEEIEELIDEGYLSNDRVMHIEHPYTPHVIDILTRNMGKITLQITQDCNLRCGYCLYTKGSNINQRTHNNKVMSFEVAKSAIDYLIDNSIDSNEVDIGFYGGEPLLEFNLIKQVVTYVNNKYLGKRITFSMTTNGTLLNEEIVSFLNLNNFSILISLDGGEEVNDANRVFVGNGKGSYRAVVRNIEMIKNKFPQFWNHVQLSVVMDPQNSFYEDYFQDMKGLGFSIEQYRPSLVDCDMKSNTNKPSEEFFNEYNYQFFLALLSEKVNINKENISPIAIYSARRIFENIEKRMKSDRLPSIMAPSGPCIPGRDRLFVSVDGTFYPCERVSEVSEIMKIGDIQTGLNYSKVIKLLNVAQITSSKCKECWGFRLCQACVKHADDNGKLSSELRTSKCEEFMANIEEELLIEIMLYETTFG